MNIMKEINKKVVIYSVLLLMTLGIVLIMTYKEGQASVETISNKIIRFHVIANSDTVEDQSLKLAVRDEVLEYIQPKLQNSGDLDESREILEANKERIIDIAREVIEENGYDYEVDTSLKRENFPVKTYGNITLPEGEYEAFKIVIGTGEGHNWWCVMFPPLCFTDITKEESVKENEENLKKVLSQQEYEMVDNTTVMNNDSINYKEEKGLFNKFKDTISKIVEENDEDNDVAEKNMSMKDSEDNSTNNLEIDGEKIKIRFRFLDFITSLKE